MHNEDLLQTSGMPLTQSLLDVEGPEGWMDVRSLPFPVPGPLPLLSVSPTEQGKTTTGCFSFCPRRIQQSL